MIKYMFFSKKDPKFMSKPEILVACKIQMNLNTSKVSSYTNTVMYMHFIYMYTNWKAVHVYIYISLLNE